MCPVWMRGGADLVIVRGAWVRECAIPLTAGASFAVMAASFVDFEPTGSSF